MSAFVESLKRLYKKGSISAAKLAALLTEGKISQEEYGYITGNGGA